MVRELWTCTPKPLYIPTFARSLPFTDVLPEFDFPKCITTHLPGLNSIDYCSAQISADPGLAVSLDNLLHYLQFQFYAIFKVTNQTNYIHIQVFYIHYYKQQRSQQQFLWYTICYRLWSEKYPSITNLYIIEQHSTGTGPRTHYVHAEHDA